MKSKSAGPFAREVLTTAEFASRFGLTLRAAERAARLLDPTHPDFIDLAAFEKRFSLTRPRRPRGRIATKGE